MCKGFDNGESEGFQVFKVSEIAEKLGKTKNSVYKKTNRLKLELKPHRKKLNGVIYYDEEGFDIIRKSYGEPKVAIEKGESRQQNEKDKYIELLLSEKDKQISQLTKQLAEREKSLEKALELTNQTQHLLAIEKQLVLQLQEPQPKKSFWDKFKKSKSNSSWDNHE